MGGYLIHRGSIQVSYAMQRLKSNILRISVLGSLVFVLACEGPCVALAKDVCRCLASETEQKTCIQNVENEAGESELSADEEKVCEALLETCTCNAIENKEYALCGMAHGS